MGLLDQLSDAISGGVQQLQDTVGQAGGALGDLLKDSGGIDGLVERFQQAGLGDTLQSWISQGENLPISAEQLQQVFSADTLNSLAEKAGIDPAQAGEWLSANLPEWVNQLTPNGSLSDLGGVFEQGVSAVKDFFSKF